MKNKTLLLTFVLILFSAVLYAQPQKKINFTDSLGRKQGYWKKIVNDTLKYEGTFKDNNPDGEFKYYYPDKSVKALTIYSNDGKKAKTVMFYNNGKKNAEGSYVDKQKDGLWVYYNKDQVKMSEENYQNGLKSGVWKYYYDNSKINKIENYKNNMLDGECLEYYPDSLIKMKSNYKAGKRQGLIQFYDLNGKVFASGNYLNDLQEGVWMFFNDKGAAERRLTFKAGNLLNEELVLASKSGNKYINIKDIAFCEKKDSSVFIRLNSGEQILVPYTLTDLERILGEVSYFRINANFIISIWSLKNRKTFSQDNPVLTLNPDPGIPVLIDKAEIEGFMSWAGLIKYDKDKEKDK